MDSYTCTQFVNFAEPSSCVNGRMSTTYTLDAASFTKPDLNLFMESLETIARIEQKRHEHRQQRRMQKLHEARIAQLEEEQQQEEEEERRNISPIPSAEEAVDEPTIFMEAKWIPHVISGSLPISPKKGSSEYDEAYSSANQSPRNSVSSCSGHDSDSGESCFCAGTQPPLRPRSQVITKPKDRTTHSRIISMVRKLEYAKAPSSETVETPLSHEEHQLSREQLLNSTIKQHYEKLSALEQNLRFLDKALNHLTL